MVTGSKTKARIRHMIFLIVLLILAAIYIYPVFLMLINS